MVSRYQFLATLHDVLRPATYLDIGVQNGHSMKLARHSATVIGVDPYPTGAAYQNPMPGGRIYTMTSDAFFDFIGEANAYGSGFDLVSIDGMHLFEYVLRDFMNCERYAAPGGVIAFDDVSPYSQLIATREQPPGDWTGDVWKIRPILAEHRPDLAMVLVDTTPTGTLLVWGLDPSSTVLRDRYADIEAKWLAAGDAVPAEILRDRGVAPHVAIEMLKRRST